MNPKKKRRLRGTRTGTSRAGLADTSIPHKSALNAQLLHMQRRGVPATLKYYLRLAGLSMDDLEDGEVLDTLPPSIRELYDAQVGNPHVD